MALSLRNIIGSITGKVAFEKTQENFQDIQTEVNTHLAKNVQQAGGVHGLEIEEGSWTPVFGGSTANGSMAYSIQEGYYKRINDLVFISGKLKISSVTTVASGAALIRGLPFSTAKNSGLNLSKYGNVDMQVGYTQLILQTNSNFIYIFSSGDNLASYFQQASAYKADFEILFSGFYLI